MSLQPMPELSPEQHAALRAGIASRGVLIPVVVDQHGRIVDGNHRAAIADELGIDYPTETRHVADDAEALDLAVTLNCARRHLSREQVQEIIIGEINRKPEESDRAIARRVGCSPSTVGAVRRQVSKLDTPMTREEAEASTQQVRDGLVAIARALRDIAALLILDGVPPAKVVLALTQAESKIIARHSTDARHGADVGRLAAMPWRIRAEQVADWQLRGRPALQLSAAQRDDYLLLLSDPDLGVERSQSTLTEGDRR